jgi:hypothetical protein
VGADLRKCGHAGHRRRQGRRDVRADLAPFSDNDRAVRREIRAAVDRLSYIDDEATTFAEALAREHANLVAKELERSLACERRRERLPFLL